jgi:hypothetical protein
MSRVAFLPVLKCERAKCNGDFIPSRPAQTTCNRCWIAEHPDHEIGPALRTLLREGDKSRVVRMRAQGLTYLAIAGRLGISIAKASELGREASGTA